MNIIHKALVGSRLHQLHNDSSDYDYKYVFADPLKRVISPFAKSKNKSSVSEEQDDCYYELSHFVKLLAVSNPTVLETLWATNIQSKPVFQPFIEGRQKALDTVKIFYAHKGYASDQRHKMSLESPNEHRSAKAIVAYIRAMLQGISLLKTGDFDPVIRDNNPYKNLLIDIKYSFNPKKHIPIVLKEITSLEAELQTSFDNAPERKADISWLEDTLYDVYMELANESYQQNSFHEQISRCTS